MSGGDTAAFLALWNGIAREDDRTEYEQWHTFEHVPERTALPGFVEAERYRSTDPARRYFTLYRLASLEALDTPLYRDVFTNPTPWSARMRATLSDFYRLPCQQAGLHGANRAPQLATLRWRSDADGLAGRLNDWLAEQVLHGRLVHAEWGWAPATQAYWKPNHAAEDLGSAGTEHVALLQHFDVPALNSICASLHTVLASLATGIATPQFHELQSTVRNASPQVPRSERLPPHTTLFHHYTRG